MIHIYHMHITIFSPSGLSYEDTYNTLKYADRAMNIKCKVVKNELSVDMHVSRYAKIVEELRLEVNKDITRGCALIEPSGPWRLTFALGQLANRSFFIQSICWAP